MVNPVTHCMLTPASNAFTLASQRRRRPLVYGGAGADECYIDGYKLSEGGWQQGSGTLPDVPMAPFD
eukprot:SAG25_NODE_11629_length_299_cov_2.040000_1_plen_67_part_00